MTRPFRSRRRTRRALARMRRESESGTRRWGDLTDSGHGRKPAARSRGSALRRHAKFSALQSLENSQNAERTSILCEPALRPCGTSRANEEGVDYGGRLRCPDRLYFLGRRFGSPDDAPSPGSGQQRFSFGKSETRGTVFPCRSTITTPSPRPAGSSGRRGGEKFGDGHFGFGTLVTP